MMVKIAYVLAWFKKWQGTGAQNAVGQR